MTAGGAPPGIRSFKDFLNRCSQGAEVDEAEATANRAILKEWLEAQCRNATATTTTTTTTTTSSSGKRKDDENDNVDKELGAYNDVAQIWSYASQVFIRLLQAVVVAMLTGCLQNNSISLLSLVPSSVTILIRLCSHHEDLRPYGTILIKSLVHPSVLKIVYRGLTGTKDNVTSPCLRMLTEMNRFNFGALCGLVHSSFDFTIKELPRNLEVKNAAEKSIDEDPARPSVRTMSVRFFLSFLQNGEPSVRNEMLGLRNWITPLFKHLKTDTAPTVCDLLDCMATKVLAEKDIPRATKTNAFNEWILSHIFSLHSRQDPAKLPSRNAKVGGEKEGGEKEKEKEREKEKEKEGEKEKEEKPLASVVYEFLLKACTQKGSGICFPDRGWYPPGHSENGGERKTAPRVCNRILSAFLPHIKPFADTAQLDLMLQILRNSPELVADHFLSGSSFSFEPKLTSTWIGYCTFLSSVIALPIPDNFGAPGAPTLPPPANVVIENIMPKPLSKAVMAKCLAHENRLIAFLATRLLTTAFQKLRAVLDALETVSSAIHDPAGIWGKCRVEVTEGFCKRIPDVSVVSSVAAKVGGGGGGDGGGGGGGAGGVLQTEAKMRLLADYYATIPEVALSGKFDINLALTTFLRSEDEGEGGGKEGESQSQNPMRQLEIGHILKIANEAPDVKWWNKTCKFGRKKTPVRRLTSLAAMKHSPFVAILKLCCLSPKNAPNQQIRALLHSFAAASYLFQAETAASPLDALLESLSTVKGRQNLEPILSFLDEAVARCVQIGRAHV